MEANMEQTILRIMDECPDLTLATVRPDGYPQATTISYAHSGLDIYGAIGKDSQKARNLDHCDKISLTINPSYSDWNHIKGLSMGGTAWVIEDKEDAQRAAHCLQQRFPEAAKSMEDPAMAAQIRFIHIRPEVISVLDYEKGFGHTDMLRA